MRQRLGWAAVGAVVLMLVMGTAWTTPDTVTLGEEIGVTWLNTYVRDNTLHLKENIASLGGFIRGIELSTHPDADKAASQVLLSRADQVVLDNGVGVSVTSPLVGDATLSGCGGIDTGTEQVSVWYEIYLAHNGSTGAKCLLLHRAKNNLLDETYDSDDTTTPIRRTTSSRTAAAQSFQLDTAGPVPFVDVELIQAGSVTGNIWVEIQGDAAGVPSGTVAATSQKLNAAHISTSAQWVRFPFNSPATLLASTTYHLVVRGDWSQSDAAYIGWRTDTSSPGYTDGTLSVEETTWTNSAADASFKVYVTENDTSVTMPSGYNGKALLGYVRNASSGNFYPFVGIDRTHVPLTALAIVNNGTPAIPTLYHDDDKLPPRRIRLHATLDPDGAGVTYLGPVPSGFRENVASRIAGQVQAQGFSTWMIVTETQAIYARDSSGTFDVSVDYWEW